VMRQSFAGMMWNKQFYHYDVRTWLDGDPAGRLRRRSDCRGETMIGRICTTTTSSRCRTNGSIRGMRRGIGVSYDSHRVDRSGFAKEQLILLLREWYMHPNGNCQRTNGRSGRKSSGTCVAAFRVYKIERRLRGVADRGFPGESVS